MSAFQVSFYINLIIFKMPDCQALSKIVENGRKWSKILIELMSALNVSFYMNLILV